jgi:hypothetical protein
MRPPYSRIVNVVLFDERAPHERAMRAHLERMCAACPGVRQLFVSLSPRHAAVTEEAGTLYVPGVESLVPGVLLKTLVAMRHCARHFDFEFLVRSNISTVIDFRRLPLDGLRGPLVYASAYVWNRDGPGERFASGTNIVLGHATVAYILANARALDMGTIDDVAIGRLLSRVAPPQQLATEMVWDGATPDGVVFRNRSDDRGVDVARMARIVDRALGPHGRLGLVAAVALAALCVWAAARA